MFKLEERHRFNGVGEVWKTEHSFEDLAIIKAKMIEMVSDGVKLSDLRIVTDVPFELKMAVKINDSECEGGTT